MQNRGTATFCLRGTGIYSGSGSNKSGIQKSKNKNERPTFGENNAASNIEKAGFCKKFCEKLC
jgi:hypothetical protein